MKSRNLEIQINDNSEEITFERYKTRLMELNIIADREQYYDEIIRPFLTMCCPKHTVIVPTYDDRNVGKKNTATDGKNKKRLNIISATKKCGGYIVPDYIFVSDQYSMEYPTKPYIMVETKKPIISRKNNKLLYRDLKDTIHNYKSELTAEINACGCVIFTDGITWCCLTIKNGDIVEKEEAICLVDKEKKYRYQYYFKWKHNKNIDTDDDFFNSVGINVPSIPETFITPPIEWGNLKKWVCNIVNKCQLQTDKIPK